jgi:hypothetical protein
MRLRRYALLSALAFVLAAPALAEEKHLGSTRLSRQENDVDIIRMPACREKGRVSEVKLKVHKGSVEIEKLWVKFKNGEVDHLEVRQRIPEGGESRWIDLKGGKRCIASIGIIGDTERSRDEARVDFYGR